MSELIKTLTLEKSKASFVIEGRSTLLSECPVKVEIYELTSKVRVLGIVGYEVKLYHNAELHCDINKTTRPVDEDFIKSVSRFEITGCIQRTDGKFERFIFDNISLADYDLYRGSFVFDVRDRKMVEKLVEF